MHFLDKMPEKRKNEIEIDISAKKSKYTKHAKKVAGKTGAKPEGDDKSDKKKSRAFKDLKKMNEGRKDEEGKEPLKRKEIKVQRKMHENPNYHTEMHIKKLWEKLRNAGKC
jgi:hypothetical protein